MITLLILFGKHHHPLPLKGKNKKQFLQRAKQCQKEGITVYTSNTYYFDRKKKCFTQGLHIGENITEANHIRPDITRQRTGPYDFRTSQIEHTFPHINNALLSHLCSDKYTTALLFPQYTIPTTLLSDLNAGIIDRSRINTDPVIIKHKYGSSGSQVSLLSLGDIQKNIQKKFMPTHQRIVQPYIDSQGIVAGKEYHNFDLRCMMIGDQTPHCIIRYYRTGTYPTNNHFTEKRINDVITYSTLEDERKEVITKIHTRVQKLVATTHLIYSIDITKKRDTIYLIELNSSVGFMSLTTSHIVTHNIKTLCHLIQHRKH